MGFRIFAFELLKRRKIGFFKKRGFAFFGTRSSIEKPYLQLSGVKGISIGENVTILKII